MAQVEDPARAAAPDNHALHVDVVHASPGRVRVKLPREAFGTPTLDRAEEALRGVDGVHEVRVSPASRSVVVSYDPAVLELPALLAAVARAGVTILPAVPAGGPNTHERYLGRQVNKLAGSANQRVEGLTGGTIDIRLLVPIGLGVLAAREIMRGGLHAAPWYTLLWWTFDSYLKLRRPEASAKLTS